MAPSRFLASLPLLVGLVVVLAGVAGAQDRTETPLLPDSGYDYDGIATPAHFAIALNGESAPEVDNTPADNRVTDAGAALGRVLFYDTSLSSTGRVSCASCHQQDHAFSDPMQVSIGVAGETARNSMSLVNARFFEPGTFFWDERAATLEDQVLMPIQDPIEMGLTLEQLVDIVESKPYYEALFVDAFGSADVSSDRIADALAQFVRSIVSTDSRYDQGRAMVDDERDPFPNFTTQENRGKQLFFATGPNACASCHNTEAFVNDDIGAMNIGLDADTPDPGAFATTGRLNDTGAFKVPSLRNVAETAPYMHDGRFTTLEQVIGHYSNGVQDHPQLDPRLTQNNGQPIHRNFSANDVANLVAFLETLSDPNVLTDERWSDPFAPAPTPVCQRAEVDADQLDTQMRRLYEAFFGRAPDAAGLDHWVGERASGRSVASIAAAFAGSPEFIETYGELDAGAYVDLVYANVLDRSPDDEGRAYWVGRLDAGLDRGTVMTQFSESPENLQRLGHDAVVSGDEAAVFRLYVAMLQRAPDAEGLEFWAGLAEQGWSLDRVAGAMMESAEFQARYGDLGDLEFVRQVYCNVLGRDPDTSGGSYWLGQVVRGADRGTVIRGFSQSTEFVVATNSLP